MSYQASAWYIEHSESEHSARLVMGSIAHRLGVDSGICWPTIETLARETKLTKRQVYRALNELIALGELEIMGEQRGNRGRGNANTYRLPKFAKWLESDRNSPSKKGDIVSPFPAEKVTSEPLKGDIRVTQNKNKESRSTKNLGDEPGRRSSPPLFSYEKQPIKTNTPHQKQYGVVAKLATGAEELLEHDPEITLGDLAERLKIWAAAHRLPYHGATVQAAIVIALERRKAS